MNNQDILIEKFVNSILKLNKLRFKYIQKLKEFSHNEIMVLILMCEYTKENNTSLVPLSKVRDKLMVSPSTITPIINTLEKKELIIRSIDKDDRRNIFIQITDKGNEISKCIKKNIRLKIINFINFIGVEDTLKLIEIINKSTDYFNEGIEKND